MKKLFLALFLLLSGPAWAANYYVATTGSDGNAGTEASPFLTPQRCVNIAVAGDTCFFRGGTYTSGMSGFRTGTQALPITFKAYPSETPIFFGDRTRDWYAMDIQGSDLNPISWLVFDGLTIDEGTVSAYINVNDSQFLNLTVKNSWGNAVSLYNTNRRNRISNLTAYNNALKNFQGGVRGSQGLIGGDWPGGVTIGGGGAENNILEDSKIYWNHGEGIAIGPQDGNIGTIIRRNIVADNWSVNLYCDGCKRAIIEDNLVYTSTDAYNFPNPNNFTAMRPSGIAISNEDVTNLGVDGVIIARNVVIGHGQGALDLFGCSAGTCSGTGEAGSSNYFRNIFIYNNTFIPGAAGGGVRVGPGAAFMENLIFKNNIISGTICASCATVQYNGYPSGFVFRHSNNIYNTSVPSSFYDGGNAFSFSAWVSRLGETGSQNTNPGLASTTVPGRLWNDAARGYTGAIAASSITTAGQLGAGSAAIDTGTFAIGAYIAPLTGSITVPFNATNRNVGPYEEVNFASGTATDTSTADITFGSAYGPLSTVASCTGWTLRQAAAAKTLTSCTRVGNSTYRLACTACLSGAGGAIDFSVAANTITDNALVGNQLKQGNFVITNQAIANNITGGATELWTSIGYRQRSYNTAPTTNDSANWISGENTPGRVRVDGGQFSNWWLVGCTLANCPAVGFQFEFNFNGGAYALVLDSCASNQVCFTTTNAAAPHGSAIMNCYLTNPNGNCLQGAVAALQAGYPVLDLAQNQSAPIQGNFAIKSGLVAGTDRICVRPKLDNGQAIAHTNTACFDVVNPAGSPA